MDRLISVCHSHDAVWLQPHVDWRLQHYICCRRAFSVPMTLTLVVSMCGLSVVALEWGRSGFSHLLPGGFNGNGQ